MAQKPSTHADCDPDEHSKDSQSLAGCDSRKAKRGISERIIENELQGVHVERILREMQKAKA